jgi:elongation factor Ts
MSTQITTELVKELRDATGVSVMQCRKALEEAEGDMEKALIILKKNSSSIAAKKADRTANDGIVTVAEADGKAILLTLHCETDFVAKNEDFTTLAKSLAEKALNEGIEAMKSASAEAMALVSQKVGEKIELGHVEEISGGTIGAYVHNGKSAVVVQLEGGEKSTAKDVAMHIAAMKPVYMTREEITDEAKNQAKEVFEKEVAESDKPQEIKDKMLEGKINTYFKEQTLMDQMFIKNGDLTVKAFLDGQKAVMKKFIRESIG